MRVTVLLLTEDFLIPVPDAMSDDAAALAEPLGIGVHAVAKAAITPQSAVIVIGPIGPATIAALRLQGVGKIIATDYSPMRRSLASEIGASEVFDPAAASVDERLNEHTGSGAAIYEFIASHTLIPERVKRAPEKACLVITGIHTSETPLYLAFSSVKELDILFSYYYTQGEFADALAAMSTGKRQ